MPAIDHVVLLATRVLEQQCVGILQVEHHHCIGHAALGNDGAGFGNDWRAVSGDLFVVVDLGGCKDGVCRFSLAHGVVSLFVPILDAALVPAQLLLDLAGCRVECLVHIMGFGMTLEDQALHDMRHDIRSE